ncbi:MAG: polyprenyl synthetase family protein [Bacteroidota bacterium]|nr:polyprenyl synthetase family protein [Bacteroidota bacterium]
MKQLASLQALFQKEVNQLNLGTKPEMLYNPMHYILQLGGKRLRPILSLMGAGIYGDVSKAMPQAIAIELFHNFSLIHDDIMDSAPLRRGKTTVHAKWNENVGILSGDAMLVKAYQYIAKCDPVILPEVLDTFSTTAIEVCEGQQMDIDFEAMDEVSVSAYIKMIQYKTSVLLGCAMKIGALVGGASKEDADALYQFAMLLGTSFQIKDDYLDVYGDPEKFGKQVGGDILSNKKTLLWIEARRRAQDQGIDFGSYRSMPPNDHKVNSFLELYNLLSVDTFAKEEISRYYNLSLEALSRVSVDEEKLIPLKEFASWLYHRES